MKRVTPFNAQDLKVLSDAISLTGNYFGKMELIFPKEWNVIVDMDAPFAGVSEQKKNYAANGPTVHLRGDSAFGKVEIRYA